MRSREVLMCSDRYADDISFLLPKTQLPPTRSDFSNTTVSMPASRSFLAAAIPDEPAPMTQAVGNFESGIARVPFERKLDGTVNLTNHSRDRITRIVRGMPEPTRTAVGAWSGGRFMRFGEALDDDRLENLFKPGDGIGTVMTADVYGEGEADRLLGRALKGVPRADYCLVGAIGHDFYEG